MDRRPVEIPNLRLIERSLTGNISYTDNDIEIILNINPDSEKGIFELSLSAKKRRHDSEFRLETRIAIEQHSERGHKYPHLQINNIALDEELIKKGKLQIILLVDSIDELESCCNGFVYLLADILELVENAFEVGKNLKSYFFNIEPLQELESHKERLYNYILLSLKQNKTLNGLVEFKGTKNEELDLKDYYKILRILLLFKFLNPILLEPLLMLIFEENGLKKDKSKVRIEDAKAKLLTKSREELQYYNKDAFRKEFIKG